MAVKSKTLIFIFKSLKWLVICFGFIFIIMIILSFTSVPFWGYYWLGTCKCEKEMKPDYIVVLGGSAMPGKSGLMRTYYAAELAHRFPQAKVIISLPGDEADSASSINLMRKELLIRDVKRERILLETTGKNTRYQALELKKQIRAENDTLLLVTSPEHMRRAILTFRKAGFNNISGLAAFEQTIDFDLLFDDKALGGRNRFLPEIGNNLKLRYQFWIHLEYEILIIREIVALGFYGLKGWI